MASWTFEAIGVPWSIDTPEVLPEALSASITERIDEFDRTYSRFRDDSLVARVARDPGDYRFPDDITELFDLYSRFYDASGGAISPLVGEALEHWGYDRNYRLVAQAGAPPKVAAFPDVLSLEGVTLQVLRPVRIDIGALGKGFLVDQVVELIQAAGVNAGVVDASGDLRHFGGPPPRVGLEHPEDPTRVVGVVELSTMSLAASSPSRRQWAPGVHHILDALTGRPTGSIRASFVLAESCALADGLATALFVVEPAQLEEYFSFHWVIVDGDGSLRTSAEFPGEVFA